MGLLDFIYRTKRKPVVTPIYISDKPVTELTMDELEEEYVRWWTMLFKNEMSYITKAPNALEAFCRSTDIIKESGRRDMLHHLFIKYQDRRKMPEPWQ